MTTTREQRAAKLAAAAVARAAAHAEDWGSTAAPRRPRNGHTASCPRWLEPVRWGRRCGLCWAEGNGAAPSLQVRKEEDPQVSAGVNGSPNNIPPPVNAELRSCSRCFAPTTNPEGHCP